MTKKHSTKRSLIASILVLCLCLTSFVGTTFAWFTDSVTSANNIIKSGKLDIGMYWADGTKAVPAVDSSDWKNAENGAIFDYDQWEPGYTEVRHIKIANNGTLALKYKVSIVPNGEVSALADVIDVYYLDPAQPIANRFALSEEYKLGTLAETLESVCSSGSGVLEANKNDTITLVLKMQESAGNEYQGLSIGTDFSVKVFATQATVESDSFDNLYDASSASYTIEEVSAVLAANKDATLVGCFEPNGILEVPAEYTGTLTVINSALKSIQGAGDLNLVIGGEVVVDANGTGASTYALSSFDGSAITANGALSISGSGKITAIAADKIGAFGIGGMNTREISINDITVDLVSGAYASHVADTATDKYLKNAPEGGAAIGSGYDGAVITLDEVTVNEAIGGSKAAAIGARFWTGVIVNIKNSEIKYAKGGASSAGIGGSRISGDGNESGTTINIDNSTVTAVGGAYGAGIGSGYDTHCAKSQPLCTINITDSDINATGGQYAAGVGTGYHHAALAGEIKNSTVNATPGEVFYKDTYTIANAIGFGVVDPTREGVQTDSYIKYNGKEINIGDGACVNSSTATKTEFAQMLKEGKDIYLTGTMDLTKANGDKYLTLDSDSTIYMAKDAKLEFDEVVILTGEGSLTIVGGTVETLQELCVSGDAELIIDGGVHSFSLLSATGNGKITVNGGILNCYGEYGNTGGGISFAENGTLIVNDGKLNMYQPFNLNHDRCDNAYIEINGGEIELLGGIENLFNVRNVMDKDLLESGTLRGSSIRVNGGTFIAHYEIDSAGDATSFLRNCDGPADGNKVLVSNADRYDCVVTGGTFYGSWQRADNTRYTNGNGGYGDGKLVENSIAGFVADGYEIIGDAVNGYKVAKK